MDVYKIGVIGSGTVGQVLASGFIKHGYEVMIGSRDPAKLENWKQKAGEKGYIGNFEDAASFGDLVVLASKGSAAKEALELAGASNLEKKVIIDATNPITDTPPDNGVLHFSTSLEESLMEQLQQSFPQARFVKAFNSVGNALMVNPGFGGIKPTMFICGNDSEAKGAVNKILDQFGWETEDLGQAESARAIEPLCILWCIPGFQSNSWNHAFKLLRSQ